MSIEEKILGAVEIIADKMISAAGYDKTIQATIISCVDAEKGKYKVKYQGNTFFAFAADIEKTYKNGVNVFVNIPENDFSKTKTIIGSVGNMGESFNIISSPDTIYEEIGFDCLIEKDLKANLKLNKESPSIVLFENNSILNSYLDKVLVSDFQQGVKQWGSFLLRANVVSSIVPKDEETVPHYGIKITFNNDENSFVQLDSEDMTGNPYIFGQQTTQTKYFSSQQSLTITKVEVYTDGFANDNVVYFSNLQLIPCQRLSESEAASRHLNILFLNGVTFESSEDGILAQAYLKEKGQVVSLPSDKISYHWFLEQPNITTEDKTNYNKYAGEGWIKATGGEIASAADKWLFFSKDFKQATRRIKCVLVYSDGETEITYSKVGTLYQNIPLFTDNDLYIEYSISTEEDTGKPKNWELGTSLKVSQDIPFFYLRGGNSKKIDGIIYKWSVLDEIEDLQSFDDNSEYITISREQVNLLKTYYCSYFNAKEEYLGCRTFTASSIELDQPYSLNIINPNQIFIYDEYGIAPTAKAKEDKTVIKPLTVKLVDTKNNQFIEADQIAATNITWYIVKDTNERLLEISRNTSSIEETIDNVEYIGIQGQEFHYTLVTKYLTNANSNNIKVKVTYNGYTLWGETSVNCYKVGDPGVRSANRYCELVPTKETNWSYMPTLIYQQNNSGWYHNDLYVDNTEWFKARVFNGEEWTELSGKSVEWNILGKKELNDKIGIYQSFLINNNTFAARDAAWVADYLKSPIQTGLFSLVQGKITYTQKEKDKEILYATTPLATLIKSSSLLNYTIQLVDNSGFKYVKYNSAGQMPQYDGSRPFQLLVKDKDNKDITGKFNYEWYVYNNVYDILDRKYTVIDLLQGEENNKKSSYIVKVNSKTEISSYLTYNIGVGCCIKSNNDIVGYYYFPIDIYKLTSDNSIVNGWDGYSLELGDGSEDQQSYLMANMVGAGSKDSSGAFTGVLMGQVANMTTDKGNTIDTGLMGYSKGQRSFFVDAEDGSTVLGIEKTGQIKIIPGSYPVIESGNYSASSGMQINFGSAPSITYGNGNFRVNSQGRLSAKGVSISAGSEENKVSFDVSDSGMTVVSDQGDSYSSLQVGGNSSFEFVKYDDDGEIKSGIIYKNGDLQITGKIIATEGRIGGWEIKAHKIQSSNGKLILCDDGRIIGSETASDNDTEDNGWLDISNRSLNWRQASGITRVWNQAALKYEEQTNYSSLGSLTTDLSGNLAAQCSGSAIVKSNSVSSLIGGNSSVSIGDTEGLSTSKNGSKIFDCGVLSTAAGTNSYLTVYSKKEAGSDIYGIKRYKYKAGKKPSSVADNDPAWEYTKEQVSTYVDATGTHTKTFYPPVSKEEADEYWRKEKKSKSKMDARASSLESLSTNYLYRSYQVTTQEIVNVVGQPPKHVKMSKDGDNYIITETYDSQVFGGASNSAQTEQIKNIDAQIAALEKKLAAETDSLKKQQISNDIADLKKQKEEYEKNQTSIAAASTLTYKIEMNGEEVKSLTFPNGYVMDLEGFDF